MRIVDGANGDETNGHAELPAPTATARRRPRTSRCGNAASPNLAIAPINALADRFFVGRRGDQSLGAAEHAAAAGRSSWRWSASPPG